MQRSEVTAPFLQGGIVHSLSTHLIGETDIDVAADW